MAIKNGARPADDRYHMLKRLPEKDFANKVSGNSRVYDFVRRLTITVPLSCRQENDHGRSLAFGRLDQEFPAMPLCNDVITEA